MTQKTYCRICEAACGLQVEYDAAGLPQKITPDRSHPISKGYVCAKGTQFLQVANHPKRLKQPMKRLPDGSYQPISWQKAMELFGANVRPILEKHGPHSIGLYFGNPLAFNALGAFGMLGLMKAVGTRNAFTSASQDCNNKFAGSRIVHGSPMIHPIPDFEHAELALMFGTNPAVSQSSFIHMEGGIQVFDKLLQRGGSLYWIDPRETESARKWGKHVALRPGSDIYLLLYLLDACRHLHKADEHSQGLEELLELAKHYPIERVSQLTAIPKKQLKELAEALLKANKATFHMSVGVNHSPFGTLCYIALQALAYLTGNFDKKGGLLFHPLGPILHKVSQRFGVGVSQATSRVGNFPNFLDTLPGGILADEILTPGSEQMRALVVVAGDPLKSIPGTSKLHRAMDQLEYLVSVDMFINQTGRKADLILPSTSWLERWDVATTTLIFQTSRFLQYAGPVATPPGQTKGEFEIFQKMCKALKRPMFGNKLFSAMCSVLPKDKFISGCVDLATLPFRAFYKGAQGLPSLRPKAQKYLGSGPRTSNKKVHFWHPNLQKEVQRLHQQSEQWEGAGEHAHRSSGTYSLLGRRRKLGHNSWLHKAAHDGQAKEVAWMEPSDLEALGIRKGGLIQLKAANQMVQLQAIPKPEVLCGTVVVPHGLPDFNINRLIPSSVQDIEPISGQHIMSGTPIQISAVTNK